MLVWCPKPSTTTPPVGGGGTPSIGATVPQSANANTMTFTIPNTIANGELMVLLIGCYTACATPSGWTLQQSPPDPANSNGYAFSKIKTSSDTSVTVTTTSADTQTGLLLGIKNALTVHKNATPLETPITVAGTTAPSVTNTVANTLCIWFAYTNATGTNANADHTWTPSKTRVATVIGPVRSNYYGVLSVVSKSQSAAGESEATKVSSDPTRSLASINMLSVSA